jgi:Arc/MetJ-type ribon-helix-helix transcriptional regulator
MGEHDKIDLRLPDETLRWISEASQRLGFASPADFIRSLIQREQARLRSDLEANLREGLDQLDAGQGVALDDALREALWQEVQARLSRKAS